MSPHRSHRLSPSREEAADELSRSSSSPSPDVRKKRSTSKRRLRDRDRYSSSRAKDDGEGDGGSRSAAGRSPIGGAEKRHSTREETLRQRGGASDRRHRGEDGEDTLENGDRLSNRSLSAVRARSPSGLRRTGASHRHRSRSGRRDAREDGVSRKSQRHKEETGSGSFDESPGVPSRLRVERRPEEGSSGEDPSSKHRRGYDHNKDFGSSDEGGLSPEEYYRRQSRHYRGDRDMEEDRRRRSPVAAGSRHRAEGRSSYYYDYPHRRQQYQDYHNRRGAGSRYDRGHQPHHNASPSPPFRSHRGGRSPVDYGNRRNGDGRRQSPEGTSGGQRRYSGASSYHGRGYQGATRRLDRSSSRHRSNSRHSRKSRHEGGTPSGLGRSTGGEARARNGSNDEASRLRSPSKPSSSSSSSKRMYKFDSPPRGDEGTAGIGGFFYRPDGIGAGTGLVSSAASGPLNVNGVPGTISQLLAGDGPQLQTPMGLLAQSLGLTAEQQKASRELYIGNLPPGLDVNQLIEFFNAAMLTINASAPPGNPVSRAWIASDGHFAFVEFRSIEEASLGLQLNGLNCMGYGLRIGRPKTYPAEYATLLGSTATDGTISAPAYTASLAAGVGQLPNAASAMLAAQAAAAGIGMPKRAIEARCDRLVILDLPDSVTCPESEIRKCLSVFGPLKVFQHFEVPETADAPATGVCVFEYAEFVSQKAMEKGLVDRVIGGKKLRVVLAEDAIREGRLSEVMTNAARAGRNLQEELGGELMKPQVPTRVIMLSNIVTRSELLDEKEYFDIVDDIHIECSHYGKVVAVEIPRPAQVSTPVPEGGNVTPDESDVGFAFVKFARLQGAGAARRGLSGRKFAGRTVEAHYFSERLFEEKQFKNPQPNCDASGRLPDCPTGGDECSNGLEEADAVPDSKELPSVEQPNFTAASTKEPKEETRIMDSIIPPPLPVMEGTNYVIPPPPTAME